jgi:Na+-transporting methylmalonyl-CoA/oxaloacetate decarboxylase gamma subunit
MKKKFLVMFLMTALVMMFSFAACSKTDEASEEPAAETTEETADAADESSDEVTDVTEADIAGDSEVDASVYGYGGSDPVEAAVYKYMVEEISKQYDTAEVSIPTVMIVAKDLSNEDDMLVYGDFWIENYNIDGDTLMCVSGGNYPGVMHLNKDYVVTKFDQVEDGANFEESAKELFGEHYDDFFNVYSDDEKRQLIRKKTVADYVNLNGLSVTKYQDEGWPAVELYE